MTLDSIDEIAVLGAGTMGHGIAEVAALAGYSVNLRDISEELVTEGLEQIEWSLGKLAEHGHITEDEAEATAARITPVVPIDEAVRDADFVIEAVPERMEIKQEVFEAVSTAAPDHAFFATNTSSLSVSAIAAVTDRPEQCCGMHFFNPPVRMDLVEVIAGDKSSEDVLELTTALAEDMGKTPVRVSKDSPGFIVNRVLTPFLNEAAWLVHTDTATRAEIDSTVKYEMGFPMGAFELTDQVGIDVSYDVLQYIHSELGEAYEPAPLLKAKVDAGELGQKSGHGFYDYENGGVAIPSDAGSEELAERLLAIMANEVGKLVGESVATPNAIDTALELGAGFPDGPAKLADDHGVEKLRDRIQDLHAETETARYSVADGFRDVVKRGGFHDVETTDDGQSFDHLRLEYPGTYVGAIVVDRPHRLNAISQDVLEELPKAVEVFEADDDVRAIMLKGAGDRAFSVGADIQSMSALWGDELGMVDLSKQGQEAFGSLIETDLPVIAAIDGYCLGGGMELATAADLRIAAERAEFGQPERDLGLLPGWGGTQRLAPIVGTGRAKEIIYTGDRYDAEQMAEYGFVNRLVPNEDFEDEALAFAEDIAAGPPIALGLTKRAIQKGSIDSDAGLEVEAQAFGLLTTTDDLMEGITAFLEDRDPEFDGK